MLRSKEIEAKGCNGDAAFLEVHVQQLVIEFILNHVDEIFSDNICVRPKDNEGNSFSTIFFYVSNDHFQMYLTSFGQ